MSNYRNWRARMSHCTGIDRPVLYTVAARLFQMLGSVGTVLLILRFLSPIEQGYYYTLLSLAALQTIFELGFSFVVLQLAAHESALLDFDAGGIISGDPVAHARLASILKLTLRWYLLAAVAMVAVVLPVGVVFFSFHSADGPHVAWMGPWMAAIVALAGTFFLTPFFSFLEGCKLVRQVAWLRMLQAAMVVAVSWAAIASGRGLYAIALVNLAWIAVGLIFLLRHRRPLIDLLACPAAGHGVSWREEIWPFQWKIAVSWFCSYFTVQFFTPILFAFRGPREAGRMGLSLSITGYLPVVALCWISTKAAPFGQMIRLGHTEALNRHFFRALRQALAMIALLVVGLCVTLAVVNSRFPSLRGRMEPPVIFTLLLLAGASSFVVQSLAVYLRSFKKEPFLGLSTAISALTLAGVFALVPRWGSAAAALVYFSVSGVMGLLWAVAIFVRHQHRHLHWASSAIRLTPACGERALVLDDPCRATEVQ